MLTKLLPILLLALGIGAGGGAGLMLRPAAPPPADTAAPSGPQAPAGPAEAPPGDTEIVKLNNQFVVPVVVKDRVAAMVVLSLGIEITQGQSGEVFQREPKLRDAFLQALFNHANIGGFDGEFTQARNMDMLRDALLEEAVHILGESARGILITEIARQDI